MTRRFREELARGRESVRDAVGWTVATAGEAILFSGLTVIIGFVGLLLIGIQFMTSIGLGGACRGGGGGAGRADAASGAAAVLGPRVNALRVPLIGRLAARDDTSARSNGERAASGTAGRWAVMRRPVLIISA